MLTRLGLGKVRGLADCCCKFRVRKAADDASVAPMVGAAAAGRSGAWGLRWLVLVVSVRCVALRAWGRF